MPFFLLRKAVLEAQKTDSSKLYVRFETLMEFYVYSL